MNKIQTKSQQLKKRQKEQEALNAKIKVRLLRYFSCVLGSTFQKYNLLVMQIISMVTSSEELTLIFKIILR